MQINEILLKVLFLVLPGIISMIIFKQLKANKVKKDWEDFIEIFLFAIFSYFIYFGIIFALNNKLPDNMKKDNFEANVLLDFDNTSDKSKFMQFYHYDTTSDSYSLNKSVSYKDKKYLYEIFIETKTKISILVSAPISNIYKYWHIIIFTCIVGIILSIITSFLYNYKIINKFGRLIHVTKSFGDENVWEYLQNSPELEWVFLRDIKNDLTYYGQVLAFSTSDKKRELLLGNVTVFKGSTSDRLYDMEAIYISKDDFDFVLEMPFFSDTIPDKIEEKTFENDILKNLDEKNKKYILDYYIKDSNLYVIKANIRYEVRLKIRKLLEKLNFKIIDEKIITKKRGRKNGKTDNN